jgi:hypothetical protein
MSILGFTIGHERIAAIHILADPGRLRQLDLSAFEA